MASHHVPLYFWLSIFTISQLAIVYSLAHESNNYIIHMDSTMMPKAFADHRSWYMSTVDTVLSTSSVSSKLIYSYTHVMNGFSASLSVPELEALKTSPGYISSVRDMPVKPDTTHSSQFLGLNSKTGAWPVSNFGKGTIIGVVDTGVWPESQSFNDDGMPDIPPRWKGECQSGTQFNSSLCNKKLIGAKFFNKGLAARDPNVTFSMNSTRDTDGHGTHTSSTAAGNYVGASYFGYAPGTASGMAPKAHVAMYKALWEEGALSSDIIAAIEQAIMDGVDVLSLSFGLDGVALYEDPVAIATFSALEKGVFVSTSAGNEGPFYGSLHNGIPWVLTVAAGTIDREFQGTAHLGNGVSLTGSTLFPGVNSSSTPLPIVFMKSCDSEKKLSKVGNKFVVCENDSFPLEDQYVNVQSSNVAGGIFITNNTDLELFLQSEFPSLFLSPKDGDTIKKYINKNSQPTVSLEFQKTLLGVKPAPLVTSYTSRGPSSSFPFTLKPDITAPGSLILAGWPQNLSVATINRKQDLFSNFDFLSGTSMACPHAAGLAALIKGAHPEWSPAAIRSAMMTTSDILDNTISPIKDIANDLPANPLAMGAGHINPNKALDPGLIYDATIGDYVNLLCALNYTSKQIQTITKSPSNNCSTPSLDLNYPSFIAFFNVNGSTSDLTREFKRTVTNVGKGQATYMANVGAVKGLEVAVVPSKLVFTGKGQKQSFKVSVKGPGLMKETVAFGYLTWTDSEGKHVVRSPIVATKFSSNMVVSRRH